MTHRTLVLAFHSIARIRGVVVGLAVLLCAFQFLLTQVAAYLTRQRAFGELSALVPDFVRSAAGPSALTFMSFTGIVSLGYFHPMVIGALVGLMIAIATEPASEVETRFVDLTLARPVSRAAVIIRTLIVLSCAGAVILGSMMLGTWVGLTCCVPAGVERPSFALTVSLAVTLASVAGCWAGIALAMASAARRRVVSGAAAGVTAFGAYLLDYLGRAWEPARAASVASPFHYFEPMALIAGEPLNVGNVAVLILVGGAATAIAFVVFARRDI